MYWQVVPMMIDTTCVTAILPMLMNAVKMGVVAAMKVVDVSNITVVMKPGHKKAKAITKTVANVRIEVVTVKNAVTDTNPNSSVLMLCLTRPAKKFPTPPNRKPPRLGP